MIRRITCLTSMLLLLSGCAKDESFDATGTFEATEVIVSSEAAGRILYLNVEEGDTLQKGQLIGAIDTMQLYLQKRQLERQIASLSSNRPNIEKQTSALREQITKQETECRRIQNLYNDGAATSKQLDDVQAQLKVLKGQLSAMLSTLNNNTVSIDENNAAARLQIAQVEDRLEKCHITAPLAGTVLAKYSEAGEMAVAGKPLIKIADLSRIHLRAYFTSEQLAELKLGQTVTVTADYGGESQIDYTGQITWIASECEFTPKTIQTQDSRANLVYAVKIAVKNDGRLKIGMYGRVKLRH